MLLLLKVILQITRGLLQSIGPQDAEQNFFNGIIRGIDHADLLVGQSTKTCLNYMLQPETISAYRESGKQQKKCQEYIKHMEKEDNFGMVEDVLTRHGSTKKNREAMYAFFQKIFNNPGNPADEEVKLLTEDEMKVTTTGQVSTSFGGETVFSLNRKEAEKLVTKLEASRNDLTRHLS